MEFTKLIPYLGIDKVALFGLSMYICCIVVVMYIFMGQLLIRTGGSEWFTQLAASLMGRTRGGAAKIAVVASAMFGSISGNAVSNVASTGVLTIPLMRQAGFPRKVAGAFEAIASTGGQITPPVMGAAGFLMAEFLQIPYTDVVLAALVPAALYYIAAFAQADLEAARNRIAPLPEDRIPPIRQVLRDGWFFPLPFVVLVLALFYWNRTPEESALWAAATIVAVSLIFGFQGRRVSLGDIIEAAKSTGRSSVDIVVIGAMAGMVIGLIDVSGLGFGVTFLLVAIGEGNLLGLMLLTAIICIIVGMGMPTAALYILGRGPGHPTAGQRGRGPARRPLVRALFRAHVDDHPAGRAGGLRRLEYRGVASVGDRPHRNPPGVAGVRRAVHVRSYSDPHSQGFTAGGHCRSGYRGGGDLARVGRVYRFLLPAHEGAVALRLRSGRSGSAGAVRGLPGRPVPRLDRTGPGDRLRRLGVRDGPQGSFAPGGYRLKAGTTLPARLRH